MPGMRDDEKRFHRENRPRAGAKWCLPRRARKISFAARTLPVGIDEGADLVVDDGDGKRANQLRARLGDGVLEAASVPELNLRARLIAAGNAADQLRLDAVHFLRHVAENLFHRAHEAENGGGLRGLDRLAVFESIDRDCRSSSMA